jgi:hypothetical protein
MTAQEAALAWAQGKKVEADYNDGIWALVSPPGSKPDVNIYSPDVFCHPAYTFRLAPEPRLRPLTIEEWKGRVGSVVKLKATAHVVIVVGADAQHVLPAMFQGYTPSEMLERWTFADGSPCGVMEGGAQ